MRTQIAVLSVVGFIGLLANGECANDIGFNCRNGI